MKRVLLSIGLLCAVPAIAQSWSGIIAPARALDWSHAGLPATLPDGETTANPWTPPVRTQAGSTIAAGASCATINAALASAGSGHYVKLGAGTFNLANCTFNFYAQNGVTLRGSGPNSTTLNLTGTSSFNFGIAWGNPSCTWLTGLSQGSTSLTASCAGGQPLVVGQLLFVTQCDTGYSMSGGNCVGTSADNGGLYVCGDNNACQVDSDTGSNQHQYQTLYVNSVSGSQPGTITVGFSPAIYMPNWNSGNSPIITWELSSSGGSTPMPYGDAIEDMTINTTSDSLNDVVSMDHTYASWIKGVRFIGAAAVGVIAQNYVKNNLIMNNYFFSGLPITSSYPVPLQTGVSSDSLILNNFSGSGVPWEGIGGNIGNVYAYNYGRDTFTAYYENTMFDHHAYSSLDLYEGNQMGSILIDDTWGTHQLETMFRNNIEAWDPPYQITSGGNQRGIQIDTYQRFVNAIGNLIGPGPSFAPLNTYQSTTGYTGVVFSLSSSSGGGDPLVANSLFRWGNCDTVTGSCRNQSSEVPTSLSGNAAPFVNSVPGSTALPASFFTGATAHPSGGTGLSWWKVCINYPACSSSLIPPYPPVGPDVVGGPYTAGTGSAYDIPAKVAWSNLPIDSTYQSSYTITGSSWSAGIETLTVSGLPSTMHLMGGFQISGGACATGSSEVLITASTSTTVSYVLASNPGSCTGTMLFPDIRQFDEAVYEDDSAAPTAATPTFSPSSGVVPQTVTMTTATGGALIVYTIDGSTPTATTPGVPSHGTAYSGPVSVPVPATLKAIATQSGLINSGVASATYTAATYTLSTSTTGSGTLSCTPSGAGIAAGTSYSCTATPTGGSTLTSVNGCGGSGMTTYVGSMPASSCTVAAVFTAPVTGLNPPTALRATVSQ